MEKLRIFIASPSDMAPERDRVKTIASTLKPLADSVGIVLEVIAWSSVVPDMGRPEQVILDQVKPNSWDVFIGILWHRFGTPPGGKDSVTEREYLSGTEEEFRVAYSLWKNHHRPRIMIYRCTRSIPHNVLNPDQYKHVQGFFKQFDAITGEHPGLYQTFSTIKTFEGLLFDNIQKLLLEYGESLKTDEYKGPGNKSGSVQRKEVAHKEINPTIVGLELMSTNKPIVDRDKELATFTKLLKNPLPQSTSILLIQDESGHGKSSLMRLYAEYCQNSNVPMAYIDFKESSLSPLRIIHTILTDLRPITLKRCDEVLTKHNLSISSTQISGNTGLEQTHYSFQPNLQMSGINIKEQQKAWSEDGARALIEDLIEFSQPPQKRFVFFFDTYEKAYSETKKWISNNLLRMATPSRASCLVIVVAGKTTPNPTSEWEYNYQSIALLPLELKYWLEYAQIKKSLASPDQIALVYKKYMYKPLKMAEWIDALIPEGINID